jgi:hypothetical protein
MPVATTSGPDTFLIVPFAISCAFLSVYGFSVLNHLILSVLTVLICYDSALLTLLSSYDPAPVTLLSSYGSAPVTLLSSYNPAPVTLLSSYGSAPVTVQNPF